MTAQIPPVTLYRIHVSFEGSHRELKPMGDFIVDWLHALGYVVIRTDLPDFFEVTLLQNDIPQKEKLKTLLLAVSMRNKMSFTIFDDSETTEYRSLISVPPDNNYLAQFENAIRLDDFVATAEKIIGFYAQVERRAKIIYGVALLEEFFKENSTDFTNVLSNDEKKLLIDAVNNLDLKSEKKEAICQKISKKHFLGAEVVGVKMEEKIAKCLGISVSDTEAKIKKIYDVRNKNDGHKTEISSSAVDAEYAIAQIDIILDCYLIQKFNYVRVTGQLMGGENRVIRTK